ncbi:hypothetical protein [cyanobacterium endosymbiont of Rhopalodia gibberula]|nr:hypothetical protein [cyanobacterium endosymbiont of Rhopalodia gibberula]
MNVEDKLGLQHHFNWIIDVLLGSEHAHQRQIIYCGIKLGNILFNLTAQK